MRINAVFPLLLLLLASPSCKSREWKQNLVMARSPIAIYLERREREGKVVPQNFAHPPSVSPGEMEAVLRSLKYHPTGLLGLSRKSSVEPIFTGEEVAALAGPLSRELGGAGPDERIRFLVARTSWKPLFLGPKGVSAVVFFDSPHRMNLAFDILDESLPEETADPRAMTFPDDPLEITGKKPEIVPPPGAAVQFAMAKDRWYPRWVVLDPAKVFLAAKVASPPAAQGPAAAAPEGPSQPPPPEAAASEAEEVKRRLKILEGLRQDGTISAEEYEKARQEILLQRGH